MKYEKYQSFLTENFQFLELKFSIYLNRRAFVIIVSEKRIELSQTMEIDLLEFVLFLLFSV